MASAALALVVALLPGVAAWWTGRRLVPLRDDPALPERLMTRRTRLAQAVGLCWVVQLFLPGGGVWMIAPGAVALLAGSFPARRALFDETWGLAGYLVWSLRLALASLGFWLLLAAAPTVAQWAGGSGLAMGGMAAGLLAWGFWFVPIFLAIVGARPLERPDLAAAFADILARSRAAPPRLCRAGPRGGRWVSALALPSARGSAVLLSDTLLDLFDREELTAVFAHEVAHLEHFDRRRCLWMLLAQWLLVVAGAVALPLATHALDPGTRGWIPGLWFLVMWLGLALRLARRQAHEAESDRRAVELCRDGEALARALTRLHALARLPRRWPVELERTASHPSLARRIQAIRKAAGTEPAVLGTAVVVESSRPGRFVILGTERVEWLDGVSEGAAPDLTALREGAASLRAVRYGELVSLRVHARAGSAASLVGAERTGASHSFPLRPEDVGRVQAALDQVDERLRPGTADAVHRSALGVVLSALLVFWTLFTAQLATPLLPGLVAMVRPSPAALAALGVTAIGQAVVGLGWGAGTRGTLGASGGFRAIWGLATHALLALLGAGALALAVTRARSVPESRGAGVALTAWPLGALAILAWIAVAASALPWPVLARLPDAVRAMPSASLALFGCAAALLIAGDLRARRGAVALLALGVLPITVSSDWLAERFSHDPLRAPTAPLASSLRTAHVFRQVSLSRLATGLRVSASGARFAVQPWAGGPDTDDDSDDGPDRLPLLIGDFSAEPREIQAEDLAFLDDERAVTLVIGQGGVEVKAIRLVDPTEAYWRVRLPPVGAPRLAVDGSTGAWAVTGVDSGWTHALALSGRVGEGEVTRRRFQLPRSSLRAAPAGRIAYPPGADGAIAWTYTTPGRFWPWIGFLPLAPIQWEIWRLGAEGPWRLAASREPISCLPVPESRETVLCVSSGREATRLWRVSARSGAIEPAGLARGPARGVQFGADGRLAFTGADGHVYVADPTAGTLWQVTPAGGSPRPFALAPARDRLVTLARHGQATTVTAYDLR